MKILITLFLLLISQPLLAVDVLYTWSAPTTDIAGNPITPDEIFAYGLYCGVGSYVYDTYHYILRDDNGLLPNSFVETLPGTEVAKRVCVMVSIQQSIDAAGIVDYIPGPGSKEIMFGVDVGVPTMTPPSLCSASIQ